MIVWVFVGGFVEEFLFGCLGEIVLWEGGGLSVIGGRGFEDGEDEGDVVLDGFGVVKFGGWGELEFFCWGGVFLGDDGGVVEEDGDGFVGGEGGGDEGVVVGEVDCWLGGEVGGCDEGGGFVGVFDYFGRLGLRCWWRGFGDVWDKVKREDIGV